MRFCALIALTLGLLLAANAPAEDIVVIANPAAAPISKEQIADIYLARNNAWTPIDQSAGSSIYAEFYKEATGCICK
jgi:hypothetical protein